MLDKICIKCKRKSDPYCIIGFGHIVCKSCFDELELEDVDDSDVIPAVKYILDDFLEIAIKVDAACKDIEIEMKDGVPIGTKRGRYERMVDRT